MQDEIAPGAIVRLMTPYREAERGLYTVVYVYRNGWLGLQSRREGRRFNVPVFVCRAVAVPRPAKRAP